LNLIAAALTPEGYHLLKATSGQAALMLVAACERPLDLVVTDTRMPGMDGVELARRLIEVYPNLAVIGTSGSSPEDFAGVAGLDHPATRLQKPFTPAQLRAAVRTVLNQRRQKLAE
jgi:DNA-binding response OmpR family regulator